MKTTFKHIFLIFCVCLLTCLSGCGVKGSSFTAFNTFVYIDTYGQTFSKNQEKEIKNTLISLENTFSATREGSFIAKINNADSEQVVSANATEHEVFSLAKEYFSFSQGKFNPAIYPLLKLWGFAPKYPVLNFNLPSDSEVLSTLAYTDFSKISLTESGVIKQEKNLQLDFGGFLKGYATDLVGKALRSSGITQGYVSMGGSSLYLLGVESLTINHPEKSGESILSVVGSSLNNHSVSTSGTYERFYTFDDQTYSHIIDSQTGKPSQKNILSATIICKDGAFADAMTTALCLCDFNPISPTANQLVDFINDIVERYQEAQIFVVYNNGEHKNIITNANSQAFSLLDLEYTPVYI